MIATNYTDSDQIKEILQNFDFEKVHAYMTLTSWTWGPDNLVPSMGHIVESAKRLMSEALKEKTSMATGGFHVIYSKGNIELLFAIENY